MATAQLGLHEAVVAGDLAAISALHADDLDLESRDARGRTAMTIAAARCDASTLTHLYSLGADPGAADGSGTYPVFVCAMAQADQFSIRDQLETLETLSGWGAVDLDAEPDDLGTALETLCAKVPPPHLRARVGAVVRLLILKGAMVYRGGLTCHPVRAELHRRLRGWLRTQKALDEFLRGCHHGVQDDGAASAARVLRNLPMVRRRIGEFVPVLSTQETTRVRHAVYAIEDSIEEDAYRAECHAYGHVHCFAM